MKNLKHSQCKVQLSAQDIRAWFTSDLGADLLKIERQVIDSLLSKLGGTHLLHMGAIPDASLSESAPVVHRTLVYPELLLGMSDSTLIACNEELPIEHNSMDVVLMHHALDFSSDPHQVLREAARVTKPGGYLVILGFNPLSLWGLVGYFSRKFKQGDRLACWKTAQCIRHHRLLDWIKLLGLTELQVLTNYYYPPVASAKLRSRFAFLQRLGGQPISGLGAFNVLMVRKDVVNMTPLVRKRFAKSFMQLPVTKPATRGQARENR